MYYNRCKQFSVVRSISTDINNLMFGRLQAIFRAKSVLVFGRQVATTVKRYEYPNDRKCRFSVLFNKEKENPDTINSIVEDIAKWSIMTTDIELIQKLADDLNISINTTYSKYLKT